MFYNFRPIFMSVHVLELRMTAPDIDEQENYFGNAEKEALQI